MAPSLTYLLLLGTAVHVIYLPDYGDAVCDNSTQFTCCGGNIECVDLSKQYDGRFDCTDGSDESPAINETLADRGCCDRPDSFHCRSGGCVPPAYILDGYNDCNNGDDVLADDEHKYIGSKCEKSLEPNLCCPCDVYVANSECLDKTGEYLCYCKSGYMSDELGMTCTKRKFGDPCDIDPDCYDAVDNTVCPPATKLCDCRNGWYVVNGSYCVRRIITDSCTKDLDCSPAVANSNCTNNTCLCNSGYIVSVDKTACNLRVLDDSCTVDTDCSGAMANSFCDGGLCKCQFSYVPLTNNTGCERIKVGDVCTVSPSDECSVAIANSECKDGQCQCLIGYKPSTDSSACVSNEIGDSCISDAACRMPNSACTNGVCQCNTGYKPSADGLNCYEPVLGSEPCSTDSECSTYVNNSVCVDNTCDCQTGYYRDSDDRRCNKLEIGKGSCNATTDCLASIPNSVCEGGLCSCEQGYYQYNVSFCDRRDVGSYCDGDDVCSTNINQTYCDVDAGQCRCLPGYSPTDDDLSCTKTAIGERCDGDEVCTVVVVDSRCVDGRCHCVPGYAASQDGRTCTARRIGDTCLVDGDCSPVIANGRCVGGVCACPDGYLASSTNTSCDKIPIEELPCSSDVDCSRIENGSVCGGGGRCVCDVANGYYMTPDGLYCEPYKTGQARCLVNTTCTNHDPEARCIDGICDCPIGYYPKEPEMMCAPSKVGVIPCTSSSYCARYMADTECISGLCQCACGHYETKNGYKCTKISLGQNCSLLPVQDCGCAISNASCQNGDCLCLPGHTPSGNYTCIPPSTRADPSTAGTGCKDIMKDCPWVVGIAATIGAIILAAAIGGGAYLYKKYKKGKPTRAVSPTTTYGPKTVKVRPCSGVPIMYESDFCKEPDDISA